MSKDFLSNIIYILLAFYISISYFIFNWKVIKYIIRASAHLENL